MSKKIDIVEELVNARINGNKIEGSKTYEAMLKSVAKDDINNYALMFVGKSFFGSKLEMIEQIKNSMGCNNAEE